MNQEAIGKFISTCRKEKGLTQTQLAEKLNITNRAVSKWETGKSVPDAAIMLDLCEILDVSVNELLSGERIAMENYQKKAVKLAIPVFGLLLLVKYGIGSRTRSFIDPLFYALVINAVLVPLYFELNRLYAENAECEENIVADGIKIERFTFEP